MSSEDEAPTCRSEAVLNKYKTAGEIVNRTLQKLIPMCKPGAVVLELCEAGDKMITDETSVIHKKAKSKGTSFPTCICLNNCICHYSPLRSEAPQTLKEGDLVKIDLGAHIDGFIAVAAHTLVVGATKENKVTGRKADVIMAAHKSIEAALRLVRPGKKNTKVTETTSKICESFKCLPIEGMLSHQLNQFEIDGEKSIIQNPNDAQKKEHEEYQFEDYEVFAVDVLVSTGEGRGREKDTRCTVYKRTKGTYLLKMKASRTFFGEMERRFGTMPFTLRAFEDETRTRLAVQECVSHMLLDPFHVLFEKDSECVAQFKYTVILMPNGTHKITGLGADTSVLQSEHKIEDSEVKEILMQSWASSKKKTDDKVADKATDKVADKAADKAAEGDKVDKVDKPAKGVKPAGVKTPVKATKADKK